jgi:hypothetical protein
MPRIDVVFYQEDGRDVPVLDWLKELRRTDQRAYESCVAAIGRLSELDTICGDLLLTSSGMASTSYGFGKAA